MTGIPERLQAALARRYSLERRIGSGGMATVWLARDLRHDRLVAVKVLRGELAAALGPERFLREIRTTANLSHPHILPLFDSGEAEGCLYYVMPFIRGESLRERLNREKQLPLDEALRIAGEVADALAYAHSHGIIHRDVKPENILMESGHAVVADFGIARAVEEAGSEGGRTATGVMLGTPTYMSPEQAGGSRELDGRSDVYALGCVLYEMLTGEAPFSGPTAQVVLARKITESPAELRRLRPAASPELERLVSQALAVSPADRQPTAADLSKDLALVARSPREMPRPIRARRIPLALRLGALAALVLAGTVLARRYGWGPEVMVATEDRVAVLPYENRTGDPTLDAVGPLAADWITQGLTRAGTVEVVPSSVVLEAMAMAQPGRGAGEATATLQEVTALTQSTLVVTGSYYLRGDDLELHSEIVQMPAAAPLVALDPVRGSVADPAAAVDRVRIQVMGALASRLSQLVSWEFPSTEQPPSYEAFQHYTRGWEAWFRGDYPTAGEAFAEAYDRDTTQLRALVLSATAHGNAGSEAMRDSLMARVLARKDQLSPYERYRLEWVAANKRGDLEAALAAARSAVKIVPFGTQRGALIQTLLKTGRPREALTVLEEVPASVWGVWERWYAFWDLRTEILHLLGKHQEELDAAREARRVADSRFPPLEYEGRALAALGLGDVIVSLVDEILAVPPPAGHNAGRALLTLARELRAHGDPETAGTAVDRALAWHQDQPETFRLSREGRMLLGELLYAGERWDGARRTFDDLATDSLNVPDVLGFQAVLAARGGEREKAARLSQELEALPPAGLEGTHTVWRARIAALLGERETAVQLLRRAFREGASFGLWLHTDPDLGVMTDYAPLQELLAPGG
jgi:tetratricopeptide (TPR) repeat protein/TolB-like protein